MKQDIFSIEDKVVIITGAAGLLGYQHSDAVASFGGNPVLIDINNDVIKYADELNKKYKINASGYVIITF